MPGDLSVVGFDDLEVAPYVGLTTVHQPLEESGRRGVERLLAAIARRGPPAARGAARAGARGAPDDRAAALTFRAAARTGNLDYVSTSAPTRTDGTVQALTRAGIWVLLVLAAANGLFLYLVPGLADTDYAWSIKPAVNAAFIGAGFLAGTVATGLVLATATRWRTFSTLPIALWVLAGSLLGATIIHADRFKWDYRRPGCGRSCTPASRSPCRSSSPASATPPKRNRRPIPA